MFYQWKWHSYSSNTLVSAGEAGNSLITMWLCRFKTAVCHHQTCTHCFICPLGDFLVINWLKQQIHLVWWRGFLLFVPGCCKSIPTQPNKPLVCWYVDHNAVVSEMLKRKKKKKRSKWNKIIHSNYYTLCFFWVFSMSPHSGFTSTSVKL